MSNNTVTLTREIKRELRFLNLKSAFILFGSTGAIFATGLMVLLAIIGLPLQGLLVMMFPTYGIAFFISGIAIGGLIGGAVTVACLRYSKLKVTPYVNIPNEFEKLKDIVYDLGSYLATIDEKLPKQLGTIFLYIYREIKNIKERLGKLEENEINYNRIIADQRKTIFDLKCEKQKLENQLKEKNDNSISLVEFERLSARLLKVEEELRNLKG